MMQIKILYLVVHLLVVTGCAQVQSEQMEQESVEIQASILSQKQSFLSFSWIEQGYNGVFVPVNEKLGQSETTLRARLGKPISEGNYEGGLFLEYKDVTYFIDPETKKNVAIAISIKREKLTDLDLKRTIGTPDQSQFNEMDGVWMYVYELGDFELMFEAPSERAILSHAWLKEKRR